MVRETGDIASGTLNGDKPYQRRARVALPILVRQARAGETVTYGRLAEEMEMSNARNLNFVLGAVGNSLLDLAVECGAEVPPLQALVVNQATRLPGQGLAWFAPDAAEFRAATSKQRRDLVSAMLQKVYAYDRWDDVLRHFGLHPALPPHSLAPARPVYDGASGESEDHRGFKEFVARNPELLGLRRSCGVGQTEFMFRSADAVDVLFRCRSEWVGVEVKSARSAADDIERGLFQCVKYLALLEATQAVRQVRLSARTILALEGPFPRHLIPLRNTLGVEVCDNVRGS